MSAVEAMSLGLTSYIDIAVIRVLKKCTKEGFVKKGILMITLAAILGLSAPVKMPAGANVGLAYNLVEAAESGGGMNRLKLVLKKLTEAMKSMKDFDQLEKSGLRKKDVDRMRNAMRSKIDQMMDDAVYAIRAL